MRKLINRLTEKADPDTQILADRFQILSYELTEHVKSRTIIMIHRELHDHFSPINTSALLSFLKAAVQVLLSMSVYVC